MPKFISFKNVQSSVYIDLGSVGYNDGETTYYFEQSDYENALYLSNFLDGYRDGFPEVHGGKGDDYLKDAGFGSVIYGDAGNDRIMLGRWSSGDLTAYGGAGDDLLYANDMTGGKGEDTFVLTFEPAFEGGERPDPGNFDAIVRDFHPGEDFIEFQGPAGATLTHEGDIWTVHATNPDSGEAYEVSYEIDGVSQLSSADYNVDLFV
jgi:hypothetical protein